MTILRWLRDHVLRRKRRRTKQDASIYPMF